MKNNFMASKSKQPKPKKLQKNVAESSSSGNEAYSFAKSWETDSEGSNSVLSGDSCLGHIKVLKQNPNKVAFKDAPKYLNNLEKSVDMLESIDIIEKNMNKLVP